jgi:hypothetical protein
VSQRAPPQFRAHESVLDQGQAHTTVLFRNLRGPKPLALGRAADLVEFRERGPKPFEEELSFEGIQVRFDKRSDPREQVLCFLRYLKVHLQSPCLARE